MAASLNSNLWFILILLPSSAKMVAVLFYIDDYFKAREPTWFSSTVFFFLSVNFFWQLIMTFISFVLVYVLIRQIRESAIISSLLGIIYTVAVTLAERPFKILPDATKGWALSGFLLLSFVLGLIVMMTKKRHAYQKH